MITEWISVKERLPNNDRPVLTYLEVKQPRTWSNYYVNFYFKGWFKKEKLKNKLNNFSKDKHGRIFTTEVIDLIDKT